MENIIVFIVPFIGIVLIAMFIISQAIAKDNAKEPLINKDINSVVWRSV